MSFNKMILLDEPRGARVEFEIVRRTDLPEGSQQKLNGSFELRDVPDQVPGADVGAGEDQTATDQLAADKAAAHEQAEKLKGYFAVLPGTLKTRKEIEALLGNLNDRFKRNFAAELRCEIGGLPDKIAEYFGISV